MEISTFWSGNLCWGNTLPLLHYLFFFPGYQIVKTFSEEMHNKTDDSSLKSSGLSTEIKKIRLYFKR